MNAEQLKASILQQAIEGKLVPQLKSEEEVKQIGDIPEEVPFTIPDKWKWFKFSDVVDSFPAKNYQIQTKDIQSSGTYPVVSQSKVKQIDGYSEAKDKLIPKEKIPLLVFGDHTRILKYIDFQFIVGADGTKLIRPKDTELLDCVYLYYALQALIPETKNRGYSRHFQFLKKLWLPVPPKMEQKRIVSKIEELLPLVEAYGKSYDRLQELNAELPGKLKASILQEALHGRLVPQLKGERLPDGVKEVKDANFDIPETWKLTRLGDLISIKSGDGLSKSQYRPGSIPVYGGNGVNGYHDCSNVEEGTLVIGRVGYYCGNVKKTTADAWVTDNAMIVKFKIEANPEFYLHILNSMNLGKKTSQTAQPVITGKLLKPMLIPVPPLEEQARIVSKVEELLKQVDALSVR